MNAAVLGDVSLRRLLDDLLGIWPQPEPFPDQTIAFVRYKGHVLAVVSVERRQRGPAERRVVTVQDAEPRECGRMRDSICGCVAGSRHVDKRRPEPTKRVAGAVAHNRACAGYLDSGRMRWGHAVVYPSGQVSERRIGNVAERIGVGVDHPWHTSRGAVDELHVGAARGRQRRNWYPLELGKAALQRDRGAVQVV